MLKLETTWKTHNWHIRCNTTILGVCIVDAWLLYKQATGIEMKQRKFYSILAEQLIDNKWDKQRGMLYKDLFQGEENDGLVQAPAPIEIPCGDIGLSATFRPHGIGLHLTPIKEKQANSNHTAQARCRYPNCRRQVTTECSICFAIYQQGEGSRYYCCKPGKSDHWICHMQEHHGICLETVQENW